MHPAVIGHSQGESLPPTLPALSLLTQVIAAPAVLTIGRPGSMVACGADQAGFVQPFGDRVQHRRRLGGGVEGEVGALEELIAVLLHQELTLRIGVDLHSVIEAIRGLSPKLVGIEPRSTRVPSFFSTR